MFIDCQSADPAIHAICIKIARKCVWIVQACLREEERALVVNEFYRECREALDKPPATPEV